MSAEGRTTGGGLDGDRRAREHDGAGEATAHGPACQTCGDVAEAMVVVQARPDEGLALCRRTREDGEPVLVETALVEPVAAGDELLVHAGVALGRAAA